MKVVLGNKLFKLCFAEDWEHNFSCLTVLVEIKLTLDFTSPFFLSDKEQNTNFKTFKQVIYVLNCSAQPFFPSPLPFSLNALIHVLVYISSFYSISSSLDDSEEIIKARCHYKRAEVDGIIYNLYDDAHVQVSLLFTWFFEFWI